MPCMQLSAGHPVLTAQMQVKSHNLSPNTSLRGLMLEGAAKSMHKCLHLFHPCAEWWQQQARGRKRGARHLLQSQLLRHSSTEESTAPVHGSLISNTCTCAWSPVQSNRAQQVVRAITGEEGTVPGNSRSATGRGPLAAHQSPVWLPQLWQPPSEMSLSRACLVPGAGRLLPPAASTAGAYKLCLDG